MLLRSIHGLLTFRCYERNPPGRVPFVRHDISLGILQLHQVLFSKLSVSSSQRNQGHKITSSSFLWLVYTICCTYVGLVHHSEDDYVLLSSCFLSSNVFVKAEVVLHCSHALITDFRMDYETGALHGQLTLASESMPWVFCQELSPSSMKLKPFSDAWSPAL